MWLDLLHNTTHCVQETKLLLCPVYKPVDGGCMGGTSTEIHSGKRNYLQSCNHTNNALEGDDICLQCCAKYYCAKVEEHVTPPRRRPDFQSCSCVICITSAFSPHLP